MIREFEPVTDEVISLIEEWEEKLSELSMEILETRRNSQNRTIKQILGHLVDSASNNLHRIVHLQYRESPLDFPNYASGGNNDRWIAIQHYQEESWPLMISLWKFSNLHWVHVVRHIREDKLENVWNASAEKQISLKSMVVDYLRHLKLHLDEISELMPSE